MDIKMKVLQDTLLVRLQGELDLHTANKFRDEVDKHLSKKSIINLIISLEDVTFIDSSGLGVLLGRYKKIMQRDGHLLVAGANPGIVKLLELSGIHKIIPFVDTEEEALIRFGFSAINT